MATESITNHVIDNRSIERIQWLLLAAIKAKHDLDQIRGDIESAAVDDYPAKMLLHFRPAPVDLSVREAAEMVQILSVLPEGQEVMP